jgi:hypothetical protein
MHKMLDRVMPGLVLEDGHDVVYVIYMLYYVLPRLAKS